MLARPYEAKDLLSAPCESRRDRPSAAQRSGLSPSPPPSGPVEPPSAICAFPFHKTVGTSLVRYWPETGITDYEYHWVVGTYRQADGSAQYLIKDRFDRLRALNASWFTPQRVRELDRQSCDPSRSAAMLIELRKGTAAATTMLKSQPSPQPSAETLELLLTHHQLARQPD